MRFINNLDPTYCNIFYDMHFNIIILSSPEFSERHLPLLQVNFYVHVASFKVLLHVPPISVSLTFVTVKSKIL